MTFYEVLVFLGILLVVGCGALSDMQRYLSRHALTLETIRLGVHLQGERLYSAWRDVDFTVLPTSDGSLENRLGGSVLYYPDMYSGKIGFTELGTAKYSGTLRLMRHGYDTRITLGVGLSPVRVYAVGL